MISKELLIEVLGSEYKHRLVDWFQTDEDNFLRTYYDCGSYDDKGRPIGLGLEINIYELAHKCKEWAYKKGYILTPWKRDGEWYGCEVRDITSEDIVMINGKTYTRSKLEPEAIFKACQWILEQNK